MERNKVAQKYKWKLEDLYSSVENGESDNINKILDDISFSGITPLNFINEFVEMLLKQL